MMKIRPSAGHDLPHVMEIWRRAVDATHHFLSPEDRVAIEAELSTFLPQVSLTLAVDQSDRPLGFMFLHDGHMEALFIHPDHHGQGIGTALVAEALARHPELTTDVNEQNSQAIGFYQRLGFERIGRSDKDGQGRPYPLLHLRFRPAA
ncbi:acetyltransferase [Magnetospirillum fulvum]|uniref:Acetyltransferase n=1 Tax=Magnetospirillum fulvum MGU-K5 TaxID=1316936 RepID=S9SEB2_MAGFU|nr:acetyltransferase [Magnetospirillum fulvum]EPY02408.1 acetyltransferase [Magnetospirillum fulvum MGU-K5]